MRRGRKPGVLKVPLFVREGFRESSFYNQILPIKS